MRLVEYIKLIRDSQRRSTSIKNQMVFLDGESKNIDSVEDILQDVNMVTSSYLRKFKPRLPDVAKALSLRIVGIDKEGYYVTVVRTTMDEAYIVVDDPLTESELLLTKTFEYSHHVTGEKLKTKRSLVRIAHINN